VFWQNKDCGSSRHAAAKPDTQNSAPKRAGQREVFICDSLDSMSGFSVSLTAEVIGQADSDAERDSLARARLQTPPLPARKVRALSCRAQRHTGHQIALVAGVTTAAQYRGASA
jgi:hypothetical protein